MDAANLWMLFFGVLCGSFSVCAVSVYESIFRKNYKEDLLLYMLDVDKLIYKMEDVCQKCSGLANRVEKLEDKINNKEK